jgi:deoxyadenosine/deoxycytidine kinase
MLAEDLNAKLILEQFADNPVSAKFYKDQERYSFPLELSFLADRYKQIKKEVLNRDFFILWLLADYYFSKTAIFAQIHLNPMNITFSGRYLIWFPITFQNPICMCTFMPIHLTCLKI